MEVGDVVKYAEIRETKCVQLERKNAHGTIEELDEFGGERCAKVRWDSGYAAWVNVAWLEKVNP